MQQLQDEWQQFLKTQGQAPITVNSSSETVKSTKSTIPRPPPTPLVISTKTQVLFLNVKVDYKRLFWVLPMLEYSDPKEGVVKKETRFVSTTPEELTAYESERDKVESYKEMVIRRINNPMSRAIKFKDERKISIGWGRKDIVNVRRKPKKAFYNCMALILRCWQNSQYEEIHVKIFNTGKIKVPGIVNNHVIPIVKRMVIDLLQPYYQETVLCQDQGETNILINSDYNLGFYIQRDAVHRVLRNSPWNLETSYEPCTYPGVKCKFYINMEHPLTREYQNGKIEATDFHLTLDALGKSKKYKEVNVMFFRTGSCLLVGSFSDEILYFVHEFIEMIVEKEYMNFIADPSNESMAMTKEKKIPKMPKRFISFMLV